MKEIVEFLRNQGHKNKELVGLFLIVGAYTVTSSILNYSWRLFKVSIWVTKIYRLF